MSAQAIHGELLGEIQERSTMPEKPRLFDDLGLVALPTAVTCARLFTRYTLENWKVSPFVVADGVVIAAELVVLAVQETGILETVVPWSELDYVNRIVVRLLGFPRFVVIEVWDAATEASSVPDELPEGKPEGLHLVDVIARRWASAASSQGRLTWAEIAVYDHTESGLPIRRRPTSARHVSAAYIGDLELLRRVRDGLNGL